MKITYLIGLLIIPFFIYGQNNKSDLKREMDKIDSIVKLINKTEKKYSEGIAEGPIIYKSIFKKNSGWEAYFLYKKQSDNPPLRIKFNVARHKTYEKYKFYYHNGNLIFTKLNVGFYRGKRKNKPIEKKYYFKNSHLIFETTPELKNYRGEFIVRTEKSARNIIYN